MEAISGQTPPWPRWSTCIKFDGAGFQNKLRHRGFGIRVLSSMTNKTEGKRRSMQRNIARLALVALAVMAMSVAMVAGNIKGKVGGVSGVSVVWVEAIP